MQTLLIFICVARTHRTMRPCLFRSCERNWPMARARQLPDDRQAYFFAATAVAPAPDRNHDGGEGEQIKVRRASPIPQASALRICLLDSPCHQVGIERHPAASPAGETRSETPTARAAAKRYRTCQEQCPGSTRIVRLAGARRQETGIHPRASPYSLLEPGPALPDPAQTRSFLERAS